MENLALTNKKTQYTANSESTNVRIEGLVLVNESSKVVDFNGTIFSKTENGTWLGNFSYNENSVSANMQTSKELLSEASQLVINTIAEIEAQLATI